MIPSYEDLFAPIEPPPGPETVLRETHEALVYELRALSSLFGGMAGMVEAAPWEDGSFDQLDTAVFERIEAARLALIRFRSTRDCGGSA